MNYRADIDGLRAIAVLAVVIFHIEHSWLPSGYLGVDVFFVISGFLITGIIKMQMQTNQFSFLQFYKRRAKRILPAFLFFVFTISLIAKSLFLQTDFARFIDSLAYALKFQANLFFAKSADYFDVLSSEKPLLHIWSLSIEEQFYFIFPILLLLCIKYFPKKIIFFIGLLILLSISSYTYTTLDVLGLDKYFLLRTRAYELLIGALFACLPVQTLRDNRLSWGLLLPIVAIFFLPKDGLWGYGYIERLILCFCTGMLLLFAPKPSKAHEYYLLSTKPFVFIGLISYSLYLWHWGVLAILRYGYMQYQLSYSYLAIAVVLMFSLATISYYFIELPCKNYQNFSNKKFGIFVILYICVMWSVSNYSTVLNEQKDQTKIYHSKTHQLINLNWDEETTCHDNIKNDCGKGVSDKSASILMIGDSHAGQYNAFMDIVGKKEGWRADILSADNCRFMILADDNHHFHEKCQPVYDYAQKNWQKYDVIVYAMYWHLADKLPNFHENMEIEIQKLTQAGKKIYFIQDNPAINVVPLRMLKQQELGIKIYAKPVIYEHELNASVELEKIVKRYPNAYWINISKYIPSDFMMDGYPIYQDRDHINPYGAERLAISFIEHEKFMQN